MLRRSILTLSRPKGPLRTGLGNARSTNPYRSEIQITQYETFPNKEHANLRAVYVNVKKLKHTELFGLPRDLGEITRNYMLRTLFLNQPILEPQLWRILKDFDDCPFDSYDHLDMVIRVALHQNWLTREKNQTDRKWYLSVHKSRASDIQALLQSAKDADSAKAAAAASVEAAAAQQQQTEADEALDTAIRHLQHQICVNIATLAEQDPGLIKDLPFVRPDRSIDFAWHVEGGGDAILAQNAAAATAEAAAGQKQEA